MQFATLPLLVSLLAAPQSSAPVAPTSVPGMAPLAGQPHLWVGGIPELPQDLSARAQQYLEARFATALDVSEDGRQVLLTTRFAQTSQLHVVEQPLGARTQLTFGSEPVTRARFQPGDSRIVFYLQDVGGAEFYQLFRLDRRTGRAELLTDGKSRHEAFLLSRDGKWLAYSGTGRNGKDTDVYVAPTSNPRQARRVTELEGSWHPVDFSADGQRLLVTRLRAADDGELHLVELGTGERRQLTPSEGKGSVGAARFTPDGKGVYLVTDRYGDFSELYRLELARAPYARAPPSLMKGLRWNVEDVALSPDGRRLAVTVNEDGYNRLYLVEPRGGAPVALDVPRGVTSGALLFAARRPELLTFSLMTARTPSDVWQYDVKTKRTVRWTRSEVGGLDAEASFLEPQLVRYDSTDGVKVPAFLYLPRQARGKVPVVVIFHGGPEGQSQPVFSPFVQLLASELGMAVLLPNVRGSEGYGKAYRAMDDGVKREASLKDIGATLDFIAGHEALDASRVGIHGGSYGGYMTLATAAFYPERIRAAVDVVGISSLPTFLENTQEYRRDLRRAEYGDERDAEVRRVQERISPLNAVERIRAALYVQQGANDPRVPQSEAEQVVKAVRARGADVWYMLALDEGHGFGKKANRDYATVSALLFFQKHLGAPQVGSDAAR